MTTVRLERADAMTVVVAHEDEWTRGALAAALTRGGFVVLPARDGREALEMLVEGLRPSLVVLHAELRDVDGLTVARRMHQHPALCDVPVVLLAAPALAVAELPDGVLRLGSPPDLLQLLALAHRHARL